MMNEMEIKNRNQVLLDLMLSCKDAGPWQENRRLFATGLEEMEKADWFERIDQVFLIGHGTSFATACNAETYLSHIGGWTARAITAFEFSRYPDDYMKRPQHTLVIGISCGRNTLSVYKGLEAARAKGAVTVCLSGDGDIRCAKAATHRIITDCAIEKRGNASHPYSVSHLFLLQAAFTLSILIGRKTGHLSEADAAMWNQRLDQALASLSMLPALYDRMGELAETLRKGSAKHHIVLGSGPNRGTMVEGALKICEFDWCLGACEELEDFAHGRFRELDQQTPLMIIAPDGPAIAKTMDILAGGTIAGSQSVVFTDAPSDAMRKLATHIIDMPKLDSEYLAPFVYIFAFWFYGFHVKADVGELVGEARYGLYAVDIDFEAHFDGMGNRK